MILKDGRIFVYEPDNRLSLEQFVDKYSKAYAKGEIKIPNISYKQTDIDEEKRILESDIGDFDHFAEKMAWKIGCKKYNPQSYGRAIDLQKYYQNLNLNVLAELCKKEDKKKVLEKIITRKVPGIGPVYTIATLYFVSKGKYPIYDRFVQTAINSLFLEDGKSGSFYPKHGKGTTSSMDKFWYRYDGFIERTENLLKMLGKAGANYIEYRELDRALWVYGHGFDID